MTSKIATPAIQMGDYPHGMKVGDGADSRFARVEAEIAELRARVERIEARNEAPRIPQQDPQPDDDLIIDTEKAEYLIGAQLLPRLGAALIVLVMVLSAVLGSSKGANVDPRAILGIELLTCVAAIGIGEWKRNELEGFGQVLTAIGACGFYLATASAYYAFGILDDRATAGIMAILAILNLVYAVWRDSRAFHVIAIVGGLAGAVVPLAQQDYHCASAVFICVAAGGAVATGIRVWPILAIVQWLLSLGALVPMIARDQPWNTLIPAFYIASLAPIFAYAYGMARTKAPAWALPAPAALFLTGYIGWGMQHTELGAVHVLALSLAAAGSSMALPRGSRVRLSLIVGAIALSAVLVPWCFPEAAASIAFSMLAIVAWLAGRTLSRLSALFAILEILFATLAYSMAVGKGASFSANNLMLSAIGLGIWFAAKAVSRATWNGAAVACLGYWALASRWTQFLVLSFYPGAGGFSTSTLSWIVYALALLILGFAVKSATMRFTSFAVMIVAVFKVLLFDLSTTSVASKMALLLLLGLLMLVGGYAYVRARHAPSS